MGCPPESPPFIGGAAVDAAGTQGLAPLPALRAWPVLYEEESSFTDSRKGSRPPAPGYARSAGVGARGLASTQRQPPALPMSGENPGGHPKRSLFSSTVHGAFSFLWQDRETGPPRGLPRGERRKERSLSGIFGVSRKWSGGVSSDDNGGCIPQHGRSPCVVPGPWPGNFRPAPWAEKPPSRARGAEYPPIPAGGG